MNVQAYPTECDAAGVFCPQAAFVECQQSQQQLERSLAEKEALLRQTAEARQDQEKVLFAKVSAG